MPLNHVVVNWTLFARSRMSKYLGILVVSDRVASSSHLHFMVSRRDS